MLVLPEMETMTPTLLQKIRDLVKAGATVIGPRPVKSPSLSDYPECDQEVQRLAAELWGPDLRRERRVGKGRVIPVKPAGSRASPSLYRCPRRARWIWHPEGAPAGKPQSARDSSDVRSTIEAGMQIESARLLMTADNAFKVRVNDKNAAKATTSSNYTHSISSLLLKPGDNRAERPAENGGDTPNPAGLIGAIFIRFNHGRGVDDPD